MKFTTEKEIWQALSSRTDGQEAFKALFLSYFPRLKRFIQSILQNENEAEDIAQDIFVSLWLKRGQMENVVNFNAYLFRIALNSAYRHIERQFLFENYLTTQQQVSNDDLHAKESIEARLFAEETEKLIADAIEQLPPQRRKIYKMSREEGLSNDEIALRLGISKRTVENHLSKVLAEIRKVIRLVLILHFG